MPDHIHLLVGWRTDETLANLMRTLKAETSGWLRRRFPDKAHFHWQEGYSVFSVSETHRKNVIEYIKNQKEHHKTQSSLDELRALLKEHGLTSDDPST
jgi:putative transposase